MLMVLLGQPPTWRSNVYPLAQMLKKNLISVAQTGAPVMVGECTRHFFAVRRRSALAPHLFPGRRFHASSPGLHDIEIRLLLHRTSQNEKDVVKTLLDAAIVEIMSESLTLDTSLHFETRAARKRGSRCIRNANSNMSNRASPRSTDHAQGPLVAARKIAR
jgi:hypothetical protein